MIEPTHVHICKMGMFMSIMGKGVSSTQMLSLIEGTLNKQFIENINTFEDFHNAILNIFNTVNAALPGKHYDVPPRNDIEEFFEKWKDAEAEKWRDDLAKESERKKVFTEFMKKSLKLGKLDDSTVITGLVTPPAAMAVKRAGESVPQLRMIKGIPDVIFVPSATVLALVSVKLSRMIFQDRDDTRAELERGHIPQFQPESISRVRLPTPDPPYPDSCPPPCVAAPAPSENRVTLPQFQPKSVSPYPEPVPRTPDPRSRQQAS